MKKILLSASVCMLALFSGCTKDLNEGNGANDNGNYLSITGSVSSDDASTRMIIGEGREQFKPGKTPLKWVNTDEIGIYSAEYDKSGSKTSYMNIPYKATTQSASYKTGFVSSVEKDAIKTGQSELEFWAYFPYNSANKSQAYNKIKSPLSSVQTYQDDLEGVDYPGKVFLAANSTSKDNAVAFKFTNTFAVINIGLGAGDAGCTISRIELSGFNKDIVTDNAILDLSKAPAAGTNAKAFMESGFYTPAQEADPADHSKISISFPDGLFIKKKSLGITWVPVMILPTEFTSKQGFKVTVYGFSDRGSEMSITSVVGKLSMTGTDDPIEIKTNDIVYASTGSLYCDMLGQSEPKTSFNVGTTVFSDDFSWVNQNWNSQAEFKYNGYPATLCTTGWPINGYDFGEKAYVTTYNTSSNSAVPALNTALNSKYSLNKYVGCQYGNGNGRLVVGDIEAGQPGYITVRPNLQACPSANLKLTFKAAKATKYDGSSLEDYETFPVTVYGPGTIKGITGGFNFTPQNPFQWTEYTVVIEGATSDTKIKIGETRSDWTAGYFYLDDVEIVIAGTSETSDAVGKVIDRPEAAITNPTTEEIKINNVKNATANFNFTVTGGTGWEITGLPDWLSLRPTWSDRWSDKEFKTANRLKDSYGNEYETTIELTALSTSDTERSAILTLTAGSAVKTFTVKQGEAAARTALVVTFGSHEAGTGSVNYESDWGITTGPQDCVLSDGDAAELTSPTVLGYPEPSYTGATTGGCYNFKSLTAKKTANSVFQVVIDDVTEDVVTVSFWLYVKSGFSSLWNGSIDFSGIERTEFVTVEGWHQYTFTYNNTGSDKNEEIMVTVEAPASSTTTENYIIMDDFIITVQ